VRVHANGGFLLFKAKWDAAPRRQTIVGALFLWVFLIRGTLNLRAEYPFRCKKPERCVVMVFGDDQSSLGTKPHFRRAGQCGPEGRSHLWP
jgi:hypothetical protein